ncbi:MAG TPA: GIY-YIG nuclease family protein [Halomicronema sp.]
MNGLSIVYVLTNPAMPGLVKIGYTFQEDVNTRLSQLYTTGVPVPFTLEYACRVDNAEEVEKALHLAFSPSRVNPKREFFSIEPYQAIAILKLFNKADVTQQIEEEQALQTDVESIVAAQTMKSKRPHFNFQEMGIPQGASLFSIPEKIEVTVVAPKKVKLGDEIMSLSAATRQVLALDYPVRPTPHWTYQGRILTEIYDETYNDVE